MVRLSSSLVLGIGALLFSTISAISTSVSTGFVANDGSVTFALNIPQDNDNDLYFALSGPDSASWIAVGLGSHSMKDSLILMMYKDSTGNNVTLSPRFVDDNVEPSYNSSISVSVLPGSGVANKVMTVFGVCNNCRSWKGGEVNLTNTAGQFIFATGPGGSIKSNSLSAGIRRHSSYGTFTMDLTKAIGSAGVPFLLTADSTGTTQNSETNDHDFSLAFHGLLMIIAFVILMPVGVVVLRVLNSPKWHGFNQALSFAVAIIGVFLGFYVSTMYNRTNKVQSGHQIFGMLISIALVCQAVIGFLHHRMYKLTSEKSRLAPVHVWLGRVVIPAGMINGFFGFNLALTPGYDWALGVLIVAVGVVLIPFAFWRWRRNKRKGKAPLFGGFDEDGGARGYQSQPWMGGAQSRTDIGLENYPPIGQNAPPQRSTFV